MYHLKEANLARAYTEVLGLDKHGDAAKRLKNWKTPVDGQVSAALLLAADARKMRVVTLPVSHITRSRLGRR